MTDRDLIERLREVADEAGAHGCGVSGLLREAAAAIEAAREDAERLAFLAREPVIEGFVSVKKDIYDYAMECADEGGRDEPDDEDMLNGLRRLIDAAIDQARGKGNGND